MSLNTPFGEIVILVDDITVAYSIVEKEKKENCSYCIYSEQSGNREKSKNKMDWTPTGLGTDPFAAGDIFRRTLIRIIGCF